MKDIVNFIKRMFFAVSILYILNMIGIIIPINISNILITSIFDICGIILLIVLKLVL